MDVQLIHGDCLEVLPTLDVGSVDAIVTDPPYGLGKRWRGGTREWSLGDDGRGIEWDDSVAPWLPEYVKQFRYAIVWGGNYYDLPPSRGWLVWDKVVRKFTSGHCELAWTNLDQPIRAFNYAHGQLATEGKYHPTQKPLSLMTWCLSFLPPGCTVLDPFAGSGTTGVACLKTGRKCILVERKARYIPVIRHRLADAATPLFAEARP
jgi:site-specific DNA-methyltransferase (adenine-specific)